MYVRRRASLARSDRGVPSATIRGHMRNWVLRWETGAAVCVAVLLVLTAMVMFKQTDAVEMPWVLWALAQRSDGITALIQVLTFLTSATPALVFSLAASVFEWRTRGERNRSKMWVYAWPVAAYVGSLAFNIILRIGVGRLRPDVDYISHVLPEIQAGFQRFSFPSGHAGAATVACLSWVVVLWPYRRVRWISLAVALFLWLGTGFGRFYLGVHWPTDVLGGYLLAGAWLCAMLAGRKRLLAGRKRLLANSG